MKKILVLSCAMALNLISVAKPGNDYTLWYDEPAEEWVEAIPLGNGRLGAMVYGNPFHEEIQLNEETIWAGGPNNNVNPNAKAALSEIRELIFEGKYREAHALCDSSVQSKKNHGMPYQVLGSLWLDFPGHEGYTGYYRDLDMENAVATVKYKVGDVDYKREIITSFADQIVAIRLTASKKGKLSFSTYINTPQKSTVETFNDAIILNGASGGHENMKGGQLKFTAIVRIYP
ncbi:MAG: glycoside hydrolase family 95 protein, partial [Prevotellaceae bacterium]|nr:glycoside hydrolase family 95 protein [Prevotellaceae bacterium]